MQISHAHIQIYTYISYVYFPYVHVWFSKPFAYVYCNM